MLYVNVYVILSLSVSVGWQITGSALWRLLHAG